jgi:hypothetical protein
MKKILGMIITIMMLLISVPHMSTNSFGDTVPSEADVIDYSADYINAWIEIVNMSGATVWDQRNGPDNIRSDSYINDGEKLIVTVIIRDLNGIFDDPLSHHIYAYLSPDGNYLGPLVFQDYLNSEDITRALFNLIFTMNDTLQCKHDVYVISEEVNGGESYEIYDSLYINPYVTASFSDPNVNWTGLLPGSTGVAAYNNTYGYAVGAFCYVNDEPEWVNIDYRLSINGTDMTQVGVADFIPCENISYDMGSSPATLLETYTLLGDYNATASPLPFNFFIDVPNVIQAGAYTGEINFAVIVI